MALVLGLNSGSSFDGVDAVIVDIEHGPDGYPKRPKFVAGNSYAWPDAVAEKVLRAFDNKLSLFELCRLNYFAGAVYAEAARSLMREVKVKPGELEVIGFDGQTIYQEPPEHAKLAECRRRRLVSRWLGGPYGCGLQIGEPSIIAAACETPTVTQFRPMENALGGTGAPHAVSGLCRLPRHRADLTLNIGGIANCQLADSDRSRMMAFDTGPGNVMMDHVARNLLQEALRCERRDRCPRQGRRQAARHVDAASVFPPPAATQRLAPRLRRRLCRPADRRNSHLSVEDLLATFTEFTAIAITRSIQDHVEGLDKIKVLMASGGGTRNAYLTFRLAERFPKSLRLTKSDEFGVPAAFKEAIKSQRWRTRPSITSPTTFPPRAALRNSASLASSFCRPRMVTFA